MKYQLLLFTILIGVQSLFSQNWKEGLSRYTDGVETLSVNGENDYVYAEHWAKDKVTQRSLVCWSQRDKILDLPYYNDHPEKKINGIKKVNNSIYAVYGEGNVTIVSIAGNGKVIHSFDENDLNVLEGAGSLDGKYFIASYLLPSGSLGNLLVDVNAGKLYKKSISYKPQMVYQIKPLKNQMFIEYYTSPDKKFYWAKKNYGKLLDGSGDNLYVEGGEIYTGHTDFQHTLKPYLDHEDPTGTAGEAETYTFRSHHESLSKVEIDDKKYVVHSYRRTINNSNYKAELHWFDFNDPHTYSLDYYSKNKYKKINDIQGLGDDRIAVFGEGNITIARLSMNNDSKGIWSITEPSKSFFSGAITPDQKYLVVGYLESDGRLGTLMLDLASGTYKKKTISYKPKALLKVVCGDDGMFYELYKNETRDYRIARKSFKKLWEDPKQKIYHNWIPAIDNGNVITDIYHDNGGLLYIGQTKGGYWFMGKYANDLSEEYWFTALRDQHFKDGCSFVSIDKISTGYTVFGGKYTLLDFPGFDINNCRGGASVLIHTDFNGNIISYQNYDRLNELKSRQTTNYRDAFEPNLKKGVSLRHDQHYILIDDHGADRNMIYKVYMNF